MGSAIFHSNAHHESNPCLPLAPCGYFRSIRSSHSCFSQRMGAGEEEAEWSPPSGSSRRWLRLLVAQNEAWRLVFFDMQSSSPTAEPLRCVLCQDGRDDFNLMLVLSTFKKRKHIYSAVSPCDTAALVVKCCVQWHWAAWGSWFRCIS